ncbi:hypothetical protein LWC34_54865 [Kibdelosporangium philippinense]|uniref:SseB protein N-terminal domain-containing protein n=1 Tax=Kibdelosporangium philippinense TaxID=211113 RepID=A0ABS8ZVS6_9PSEU|nr:SAV_915 family protein [Kibdelosporangium philippinense]MCE7011840.1 hypothetical protein [Kibdelosporangium philippinense]
MESAVSWPTEGTPLPAMFPPILYLPTAGEPNGGNLTIELRKTKDGRMALLAYSALDRLVNCCGAAQPWVVVPVANLDKIQQAQPFELVLLDVHIPDEHRHGGDAQ